MRSGRRSSPVARETAPIRSRDSDSRPVEFADRLALWQGEGLHHLRPLVWQQRGRLIPRRNAACSGEQRTVYVHKCEIWAILTMYGRCPRPMLGSHGARWGATKVVGIFEGDNAMAERRSISRRQFVVGSAGAAALVTIVGP